MVTYALGRDPQVVDPCALSEIESAYAATGYTLRGLVKAIVLHPMFRQRRPAKPDEYEYLALDPNPEGTP